MERPHIESVLAAAPKRSFRSTLFNMAHAYARAADSMWQRLASTGDADFAGPAIMCQAFAIELLLKFFLAVDHPDAGGAKDLVGLGVDLKRHKYSELFDQLSPATQDKLAFSYADLTGTKTDRARFRAVLISQGDDPFVFWRYVYERAGVSHFDRQTFNSVTDAIGKAAEAERRAESTQTAV